MIILTAIGIFSAVTWAMKVWIDWRTGANRMEETSRAEVPK